MTQGINFNLSQITPNSERVEENFLKPKDQISSKDPGSKASGKNFFDHLSESIQEANGMQLNADKMATNLASGKTENIHETMLALSQAEISFKLMTQVRNKVLEAYQEVMRMPV